MKTNRTDKEVRQQEGRANTINRWLIFFLLLSVVGFVVAQAEFSKQSALAEPPAVVNEAAVTGDQAGEESVSASSEEPTGDTESENSLNAADPSSDSTESISSTDEEVESTAQGDEEESSATQKPTTLGLETLSWLFAAIAGVSLYLMDILDNNYAKIKTDRNIDFLLYTNWYISTFLRGPIFAVVLLWILNFFSINLGTSENDVGIGLNISKFDPLLKGGLAFVLGFYSRMARKQMDIIAKTIFARAWVMAEENFSIIGPMGKTLLLKASHTFTTDPKVDVVWSADQFGTSSGMGAESGTYTSPDDIGFDGKTVTIRAHLKADPSLSNFEVITLRAIAINRIDGDQDKEEATLSISSNIIAEESLQNAEWSFDGQYAALIEAVESPAAEEDLESPEVEPNPDENPAQPASGMVKAIGKQISIRSTRKEDTVQVTAKVKDGDAIYIASPLIVNFKEG